MTTLTYIEKYNFYLSTFLNELNVVFPEYKELITKNYGDILENNNSNTDVYVKEYMDLARNINSNLAKKDDSICKGAEVGYFYFGSTVVFLSSQDLLDWDSNLATGTETRVGFPWAQTPLRGTN